MQTDNPKQDWKARLAMTLMVAAMAETGWAMDVPIPSAGGAGRVSFTPLPGADRCRVEWAAGPQGPWTNTWSSLVDIPGPGSAIATCSVPICYRVVATLSDYLVIDLSGGATATNYPITHLGDVPAGGWTDEYKTEKLVMRLLPSGTFTMGSPGDELGRDAGETQHQVTLTKAFYIGVFEVTQRQWELVMGNRPSYFNNVAYYATRPVEQVNTDDIRGSSAGAGWPGNNAVDAVSFMGKMRARTGLATFDLPTEAQAEYACRAGTTHALNSGKNLTGTDSCPNVAEVGRYRHNGGSGYSQGCAPSAGSATVGSYGPNPWGLYDMHGNVYESCLDWHGAYPGAVIDPVGAASGDSRALRGGSWNSMAGSCRSANRNYDVPGVRRNITGFRPVWILP